MPAMLTINGHDYAPYVLEMTPSWNDMDADGSGRDVQTGTMHRTLVASKLKYEVKMARLTGALAAQLYADIKPQYYTATTIDPETNASASKTYYTSTKNFGAQTYSPSEDCIYYDGMTFSMTEV